MRIATASHSKPRLGGPVLALRDPPAAGDSQPPDLPCAHTGTPPRCDRELCVGLSRARLAGKSGAPLRSAAEARDAVPPIGGRQDAVVDSDNRMPCPVSSTLCPAAGMSGAGRSLLLLQHGRNHEPGEGERGRVLFKPVNWDRSSSCLRVPAP